MGRHKKRPRGGKHAQGRNRGALYPEMPPQAVLRRNHNSSDVSSTDTSTTFRRGSDPSIDPPSEPLTPQRNRNFTVPGTAEWRRMQGLG